LESATDPFMARPLDAEHLVARRECKAALQKRSIHIDPKAHF